MHYRRLGRTGLKVSAICLGTMQWGWTADEATSFDVMDAFVEAGGNFLDSADAYTYWAEGGWAGMSEEIIGRWLKARNNRREMVIATKALAPMWNGPNGEGLSRGHMIEACEDSLRRLQTDYIDLYQTHYPDPETPIDETLEALDLLVRQGKVRYIGCSNYPAGALVESLWESDRRGIVRFDSMQVHYHLLHRAEYEFELCALALRHGLGMLPYSPLANGFLTGKHKRESEHESERRWWVGRYRNERGWHLLDELQAVAAEANVTMAAAALAWTLARPGVTSSVIGANTMQQLSECLASLDLKLEEAQIARLDAAADWKDLLPEILNEPPRIAKYHDFNYRFPPA